MTKSKDPLGCGCIIKAFVSITFVLTIILLLIAILKECQFNIPNTPSSKKTHQERIWEKRHEQQIQDDRRNGLCENCHGKGTILFSPNSWGGPGYCSICKKYVNGEHPHKCRSCNGTGKK